MRRDKLKAGLGYTGYDNSKKKYVSTRMDSAGTSILNMTGDFDRAGRAPTSSGKMDDFTTGTTTTTRTKTILVNPDEIFWEMWGLGLDSKDYKMMEVSYTRKKVAIQPGPAEF